MVFVMGCSVSGQSRKSPGSAQVVTWMRGVPPKSIDFVHGSTCKTVDFVITPSMVEGLPDHKLEVHFSAGSSSLVDCEKLSDRPSYDRPFALLMEIDHAREGEFSFSGLDDYLNVKHRETGAYKLIDIAYYLPSANNSIGELRPFCQNNRAVAAKQSTRLLSAGWYRIVVSSYPAFFSEVTVYCWSPSSSGMLSVSANDHREMSYQYYNRQM